MLAAGRVFLVDPTGDLPAYSQKSLKLVPPVPPLESPADVERLAKAMLKILENQDAESETFLR